MAGPIAGHRLTNFLTRISRSSSSRFEWRRLPHTFHWKNHCCGVRSIRTETCTAPSVLRQFKNRMLFSLSSGSNSRRTSGPGGDKPFACRSAGWLVSNCLRTGHRTACRALSDPLRSASSRCPYAAGIPSCLRGPNRDNRSRRRLALSGRGIEPESECRPCVQQSS
jgi:hypothetical protein